MPSRNARSGRTALRLVLVVLAGLSLLALRGRRQPNADASASFTAVPQAPAAQSPPPPPRRRPRLRSPRRLAAGFVVAVCFFAGAALSAGAGDKTMLALEDDVEPVLVQEPLPAEVPEPAPVDALDSVPVEPAKPVSDEPVEAPHGTPAPLPTPVASEGTPVVVESPPPTAAAPRLTAATATTPARPRLTKAKSKRQRNQPAESPAAPAQPTVLIPTGSSAMWLSRPEPVETPAALRVSRSFAESLIAAARRSHADWAVVFGILRAKGEDGPAPASPAGLRAMAVAAAGVRAETNSLSSTLVVGDEELAEHAAALARYAKAVGVDTLVGGLENAGPDLAERVLADERVDIYPAGRVDVALGRIDVRVLALIEYLGETYGQVTVSSLESAHRLFSRPGVLSAHVFGRAVDIAALGGIPIVGNQEPGGITEHAVRSILRLPAELQPKQVISLFGLGGPSFPLPDHDDHIHVGY